MLGLLGRMSQVSCPKCSRLIPYDSSRRGGFAQCECGNTVELPVSDVQLQDIYSANSGLLDYLTFKRMFTPRLVPIIFYLGLCLVIAGSLGMMEVNGFLGILYLVAGCISMRIACELLLVIFRIQDSLVDIKKNTEQQ
jgi:hypothetical protein